MFPTIYIPGSNTLLFSVDYDINAITDAGISVAAMKLAGYQLTDDYPALSADDRIVITQRLDGIYVAWSPWGDPSPNNPPGFTGASSGFAVIKDNDVSYNNSTGTYDGYEAARAAWMALHPNGIEHTGSTDYWFAISDTPLGDNSGGCSITVQVFGRAR
jgi:hypothetical protein